MGAELMRKSGMLIGGMAALGMMTAVAAQSGQVADEIYSVSRPANGSIAVSAWKADKVWRSAAMDGDTQLDLIPDSGGALTAEAAARFAAIAPAAGPETINLDHAVLALKKLGSEAVSILNDRKLDKTHRVAEFHGLMARDFDIPLMARFALGRHWKRANGTQRAAYLEAFSNFLLHQYASKIAGSKVASFDVLAAQRAGKRDVMVKSRITQNNGQVLKLVWRMRQRDGQFRVIDVVAEGISLALTKRQEFAAIIKANGGNVANLIDRLRQITA